ncbi:MAG: c-type cytochrome [Halomonas sp.]|nr:c-type cytochrome [Halomonas sp.]
MRRRRLAAVAWSLSLMAVPAAADDEAPGNGAQRLEAGKRLYRQFCASCHGIQGEGAPSWDRPNAYGELPAPPHDETGHTWKHADAMLYRIIAEGWRDPWNETERLTMPAFGEVLSPVQIQRVVDYLKTLWTPEQRRHQSWASRDAPFPVEGEPGEPGKD